MNGIGDMPIDRSRPRGVPASDGGNAGKRISVSQPETGAEKPYMTNLRKVWAGTLRGRGYRILPFTNFGTHSLPG